MINKKKTLIIIFSALFVLLLIVYIAFVRPLLNVADEGTEKLELLPGEVEISSSIENFYVFAPVSRSSIQSIEVENEYGGYKIYRDSSDNFQIDGCIGISIDANVFSSLVVSTGTVTAMTRVAADLTDNELAQYGLDTPQASWTVTDTAGDKYTVYVGDILVTEGGYYIKYADRNAVYIVDTALAQTVLQPSSVLIEPLLTAGMSQSDYFLVDEFTIFHGDELFVHVTRVPEYQQANPNAAVEVDLIYPNRESDGKIEYYDINDTLYFEVLASLMSLECESVVEFLPDADTASSYGLAEPEYTVAYTFGGFDFCIFVSALQDDGYYYATSNLYDYATICRVSPDSLYWLTKDSFSWIFRSPFYENITTVSRITVVGNGVDVDFRLTHGTDSEGYATLDVREVNSGIEIPNSQVRNFREYYKTLLNIANKEYAAISEDDRAALTADDSMLIMTMTYENLDGKAVEYKFYKYYEASTGQLSSGKVFSVIDGIGEFYTSNDLVEKVLESSLRVIDGLDIDPYGKK